MKGSPHGASRRPEPEPPRPTSVQPRFRSRAGGIYATYLHPSLMGGRAPLRENARRRGRSVRPRGALGSGARRAPTLRGRPTNFPWPVAVLSVVVLALLLTSLPLPRALSNAVSPVRAGLAVAAARGHTEPRTTGLSSFSSNSTFSGQVLGISVRGSDGRPDCGRHGGDPGDQPDHRSRHRGRGFLRALHRLGAPSRQLLRGEPTARGLGRGLALRTVGSLSDDLHGLRQRHHGPLRLPADGVQATRPSSSPGGTTSPRSSTTGMGTPRRPSSSSRCSPGCRTESTTSTRPTTSSSSRFRTAR